jgi:hypothetical protein
MNYGVTPPPAFANCVTLDEPTASVPLSVLFDVIQFLRAVEEKTQELVDEDPRGGLVAALHVQRTLREQLEACHTAAVNAAKTDCRSALPGAIHGKPEDTHA